MNIIFGTKRLGKEDGSHESNQKYQHAVVTLEGDRGKGRTRRILFNKTAMEQMGLEKGETQEIVFGTIDADENGNRAILVANSVNLANVDDLTTYKTSKNAVAFENTKEKGKAISSAKLTKDMITFMNLDNDTEVEFALEPFDALGMPCDSFKFVEVVTEEALVEAVIIESESNEGGFLTKAESEPVTE